MRKDIKTIIILTAIGIAISCIIIAATASIINSSKPIITKWKVGIRIPVVEYYKDIEKILENTKYKCIVMTGIKNRLFIVIPISINYIKNNRSNVIIRAINMSMSKVSKIILIPFSITMNMTKPSKEKINSTILSIKLVQYCEKFGIEKFMKLINESYSNVTRVLDSLKINVTDREIRKIFYNSIQYARSSAINGLLQKMEYYLLITETEPYFTVCNSGDHVCVAAGIYRLGIVIENVKTQIPYGIT